MDEQMLNDLWNRQIFTVSSVPASYANGAHNIFAITGGLVQILAIVEENVTVMTNVTTSDIDVGAVGMDNGTIAINGAVGTLVVSPLNAAVAKIAPALAVQMPSLLGYAANLGVVAQAGVNITVTFAGVAMAGAETYALHVMYRKIQDTGLID